MGGLAGSGRGIGRQRARRSTHGHVGDGGGGEGAVPVPRPNEEKSKPPPATPTKTRLAGAHTRRWHPAGMVRSTPAERTHHRARHMHQRPPTTAPTHHGASLSAPPTPSLPSTASPTLTARHPSRIARARRNTRTRRGRRGPGGASKRNSQCRPQGHPAKLGWRRPYPAVPPSGGGARQPAVRTRHRARHTHRRRHPATPPDVRVCARHAADLPRAGVRAVAGAGRRVPPVARALPVRRAWVCRPAWRRCRRRADGGGVPVAAAAG